MSGNPLPRRGTTSLGAVAALILFLLATALLTACASAGTSAADRNRAADPDAADCAIGGEAVAGLRDTFGQLSDQLNGLGPAAGRGDLVDLKARVVQGMRLANQVATTIHPMVDRMASPLIGGTYRDVATAGGDLHNSLSGFAAALDTGDSAQPAADAVTAALTSLNAAMDRMRRACPAVFADAKSPTYGPPLSAR